MSQVRITAQNMIYAQGVKLGTECLAILTAKANKHRARENETCLQHMSIPVYDFNGAHIGDIAYQL